MTIKELIEELEQYAKKHGDEVEVIIPYRDSGGYYGGYEDPDIYFNGKRLEL